MTSYSRRAPVNMERFRAAVLDGLTNAELKERFPALATAKIIRQAAALRRERP